MEDAKGPLHVVICNFLRNLNLKSTCHKAGARGEVVWPVHGLQATWQLVILNPATPPAAYSNPGEVIQSLFLSGNWPAKRQPAASAGVQNEKG